MHQKLVMALDQCSLVPGIQKSYSFFFIVYFLKYRHELLFEQISHSQNLGHKSNLRFDGLLLLSKGPICF
jgi:hypothetical protein